MTKLQDEIRMLRLNTMRRRRAMRTPITAKAYKERPLDGWEVRSYLERARTHIIAQDLWLNRLTDLLNKINNKLDTQSKSLINRLLSR